MKFKFCDLFRAEKYKPMFKLFVFHKVLIIPTEPLLFKVSSLLFLRKFISLNVYQTLAIK